MTQQQAQATILDTVARAKHALGQAKDGEAATVTVHGVCPVSKCGAMNVVEVHAGTADVTCAGCGQTFAV